MSDLARDQVALPAPAWFPLLLLLVPGVLLLGVFIARATMRGRATAVAAAPAVAIACWLTLLQLGSRGSTSFYTVSAVATLLLGVAGYALLPALRGELRFRPPPGGRRLALAVAGLTVLMVPAIWTREMFDRDGFGGHYAFIAQTLNDVLPPRDATFTDAPLQYHLGIDYLVAAAVATTRLPVDRLFDLWATGLWAYIGVCAALAARAAFGVRRLWVPAVAVGLGGGLPWSVGAYDDIKGVYLDAGLPSSIALYGPLPTVGQNTLQPPWLVGIPLFLVLVTLIARGRWDAPGPRRAGAVALLAVMTFGLALSQTALFATGLAAVGIAVGIRLAPPAWRAARGLVREGRLLRDQWPGVPAVVLGATLLGALVATAAFELADEGLTSQFEVKGYPAALRWSAFSMVTTFSVLFLLAGLVWWRRRRALGLAAEVTFLAAIVGIVLTNTVRHLWSWDMLKFGAVGVILLSLVAGVAVDDLLSSPRPRGRALGAAALVATVAGGALYLAGFWRPVLREDANWRPTTYTPTPDQDVIRALSFIREHYRLGEVTVCERNYADVCGELGGLPQLVTTANTDSLFSAKDRRRVELLLRDQDQDFRRYLDANVRWALLLRQGSGWTTMLRRASERDAIAGTWDFGPWRVVRFTADSAFTRAPFPATGN